MQQVKSVFLRLIFLSDFLHQEMFFQLRSQKSELHPGLLSETAFENLYANKLTAR